MLKDAYIQSGSGGYLTILTWDEYDGVDSAMLMDKETGEIVATSDFSGINIYSNPDGDGCIVTGSNPYPTIRYYKTAAENLYKTGTASLNEPDTNIEITSASEIYTPVIDWKNNCIITKIYSYSGSDWYYSLTCYDLETGKRISGYDVPSFGAGFGGVMQPDKKEDVVYILTCDSLKGKIYVNAWDYLADDADDTGEVFRKASYIPEEVDAKRREFEKKHNFSMYLGSEVFSNEFSYKLSIATDWQKVSETIDAIDEVLDIYPEGFFDQMKQGDTKTLAVYICAGFGKVYDYDIDTAIAVATAFGHERALAVDYNYQYCLQQTIVHEISHWIDKQIDKAEEMGKTGDDLFIDEWLEYQPSDFTYHYDYNNGKPVYKYIFSSDNIENAYFIDDYAQTYPGEDKARLFEYLMYPDDYSDYMQAPHIREKLHVYFNRIRRVFDTSTWPEETAWEQKLREADEKYGGDAAETGDEETNSQDASPVG